MGAGQQALLIAGGAAGATDPNFSSVVLLCHFEGSDASTTFTDQIGHTLTAGGDAQIDTAQFQFGSASGLFDGTGDKVTTPDSADFELGSGDFTIEAFVRFNSTSGDQVIVSKYETPTNRSWWFRKLSTGNLAFQFNVNGDGSGTVVLCSGAWGPSTNTWYYVAAKRSGTTLTVHAALATDSTTTQIASVNASTNAMFNGIASLRIGSLFSTSETNFLNGWIDELRITKGVARDVSNVPTAAFPNS